MMKLLKRKCGLLLNPSGMVTWSLTLPGSVTSIALWEMKGYVVLIDLYSPYFVTLKCKIYLYLLGMFIFCNIYI